MTTTDRRYTNAVQLLERMVRTAGLPLPDFRTRAGRRLKETARGLAEPLNVHWWILLETAETNVRSKQRKAGLRGKR